MVGRAILLIFRTKILFCAQQACRTNQTPWLRREIAFPMVCSFLLTLVELLAPSTAGILCYLISSQFPQICIGRLTLSCRTLFLLYICCRSPRTNSLYWLKQRGFRGISHRRRYPMKSHFNLIRRSVFHISRIVFHQVWAYLRVG